MYELVARGLRTSMLAVCVLAMGASAAIARPAPDLETVASEASRYSILADALWVMGLNDVPEPISAAAAAVSAAPDSAEAHLRLGLAIRMEKPQDVELIRKEYDDALRLAPTLPRAYALMGEFLSDEGDAEGVERNYQAWLAFAPDDPKAYLSYAVALSRVGRMPQARAALERSLALGPTSAAYMVRAMMAADAPHDVILADVDKALAVGGGEARIYHWRARTRWQWGEMDLALADVAKALEYAPRSFRLRQLRGEINSNAGRYAQAIAEFDALIAFQPVWPDLVNDRCWARAMAGVELEKALADCDTVLGWEPDRAEALDSRGLVKLRMGDLPGAIADYDAALKAYPDAAGSFFGRGVAKRRSGDVAGGDADLAKARELDPEVQKQFAGYGVRP